MGWIGEAISGFWSALPLDFCSLFPVRDLVASLDRPLASFIAPSFLSLFLACSLGRACPQVGLE
jgi:hypothetical protein